jgi:hypothetical protein
MSALARRPNYVLQPRQSDRRHVDRAMSELAARTAVELAHIEADAAVELARIQAAAGATIERIDRMGGIGRAAGQQVALLTQTEHTLAVAVPLASGRLANVADIATVAISELIIRAAHEL